MGKFSVKKPFTVLVAVIMVLMLGFVSISNMQTNLLPDVNTPYLMVVTVYPGASPERVESEVSDVMENALGTVAGVESITATSAENYSLLLMHFAEGTDMNSALVKVSNKVDQTTSSLPSSCLSPSIIEYSLNMNAFMTVAVSREGSDVYDLSDFVSDTLVPYVERKGGVSSVSANGLIEKMVQVQLSQEKVDAINERLLEVIDAQLADARAQLDAAEAQIEAGRAEYNRQFKNFNKTVSNTVMQQYSGEVGNAVETVRKQAQALLDSVNQLIAVVQEPEIQQALIDVRDGLQRVMDKFNETGMKDIDSLIEIVAELREITDKLTTALQQLQERLNTETGTEGSTATDLVDDLQVQQSLSTVYNTLNDVIKAMDDVPGLMSTFSDALGTYSQQQLEAYMQFTEAREMLNEYEKQLETAKQTYEDAKEKAMASSDVSKMLDIDTLAQLIYAQNFSMPAGYVKDSSGEVVLENPARTIVAFKANTAWNMTDMLCNAVNSGTGSEARLSGMPVGGKTGTTTNNCDRWFVGFTPYYVAAVWTGYDMPEYMNFSGNPAAQIWKLVMESIHKDLPTKSFPTPTIGSPTGIFGNFSGQSQDTGGDADDAG